MNVVFHLLDQIADWLWGIPGLLTILLLGSYFTFRSRFFQLRSFVGIWRVFFSMLRETHPDREGVHPLKALFASIGGAIGIGNIVVICLAVQLGGPGAIFWAWITGLLGMLLKYSEVFLGMRYRIRNRAASYDGGPMFYLRRAFGGRWPGIVVSILLCLYGVEVFMFSQVTDSIVENWHLNRWAVIVVLLFLVLYAGLGGVSRVGAICSAIIPFFVVIYVAMAIWVLVTHASAIPHVLSEIFRTAFTGAAPVGAFAGSTMWMAMTQGAARGSYSGDIGVGYASVIHAESRAPHPEHQAALAIIGIFLDTFIVCTSSVLVVLVTGVWKEPLPAGQLVQSALSQNFPYMGTFMPIFFFLLGYSTIVAYFAVGIKCARFLSPRYGRIIYFIYATVALLLFSNINPSSALTIMTLVGGLLLLFNCAGIFRLRREVRFEV